MAFKMMRGRPLAQELTRLVDRETRAATSALTQASGADRAVRLHDARKHIKKARALLQLARGPLSDADRALQTANRALGPLVDAHRAGATLDAARRDGILPLPAGSALALPQAMAARAALLEQDATLADLRSRTVRLLESVRRQAGAADLQELDCDAIVAAIRDAHAAARKARKRAVQRPSSATFHDWRKCVKREWYLVRLVSELTGDHLRDERHQLAGLDACLGQLHDTEALMRALAPSPPLSRAETARLIRALRVYARDLRHQAIRLSPALDERPRQLAGRVKMLWGTAPRRRGTATVRAWPHSA